MLRRQCFIWAGSTSRMVRMPPTNGWMAMSSSWSSPWRLNVARLKGWVSRRTSSYTTSCWQPSRCPRAWHALGSSSSRSSRWFSRCPPASSSAVLRAGAQVSVHGHRRLGPLDGCFSKPFRHLSKTCMSCPTSLVPGSLWWACRPCVARL